MPHLMPIGHFFLGFYRYKEKKVQQEYPITFKKLFIAPRLYQQLLGCLTLGAFLHKQGDLIALSSHYTFQRIRSIVLPSHQIILQFGNFPGTDS